MSVEGCLDAPTLVAKMWLVSRRGWETTLDRSSTCAEESQVERTALEPGPSQSEAQELLSQKLEF